MWNDKSYRSVEKFLCDLVFPLYPAIAWRVDCLLTETRNLLKTPKKF